MTTAPLRIALLAHSTHPRGGVVHALALGEALTALGHEACVHAPGTDFFRPAACETLPVPASPMAADVTDMVHTRIADYLRHFENPAHRRFDVFHAHDGISGNALATLRQRGLIQGFARTVHHIDRFSDAVLAQLQQRSIAAADRHFVVSRLWQDRLRAGFGLQATLVGNGVDTSIFIPTRAPHDDDLRRRLGLGSGPVILSVGGVEMRKNTRRALEAFTRFHAAHPLAQWVIAGGVSLLDHRAYQQDFEIALAGSGLPGSAVRRIGAVAQADMPGLYRQADALLFPSIREGFGLVVLEAMASGVPVVTSRIAPFTEYLGAQDVAWCDPLDSASIADALHTAITAREGLIANGHAVAARHGWRRTALAHLPAYHHLREPTHA